MTQSRLIILLFALFPVVAMGQLRATDLTNPEPIGIPSGVSQSQAVEAVINAMFARGWTVAEEGDDHVVADLRVRGHWAQVDIAVGEDDIVITYRDSDNLRYDRRGDREVIHRNYLSWVDNLVNDIRVHLSRAQRDSR